jgi:hypothetical protein
MTLEEVEAILGPAQPSAYTPPEGVDESFQWNEAPNSLLNPKICVLEITVYFKDRRVHSKRAFNMCL